jgi:hypothetical protein
MPTFPIALLEPDNELLAASAGLKNFKGKSALATLSSPPFST